MKGRKNRIVEYIKKSSISVDTIVLKIQWMSTISGYLLVGAPCQLKNWLSLWVNIYLHSWKTVTSVSYVLRDISIFFSQRTCE